jgi:hypothetical protein
MFQSGVALRLPPHSINAEVAGSTGEGLIVGWERCCGSQSRGPTRVVECGFLISHVLAPIVTSERMGTVWKRSLPTFFVIHAVRNSSLVVSHELLRYVFSELQCEPECEGAMRVLNR